MSDGLEADWLAELESRFDDLARYRMPFGRYRGAPVYDLPYDYLHWFRERGGGFPGGRLGELMEFVYHTKADGAEAVFAPLRQAAGGRHSLRQRPAAKREHRIDDEEPGESLETGSV